MTITLTVEEVKNYVSAMEHWQSKRAAALLDAVLEFGSFVDDKAVRGAIRAKAAEWDLANPMPTLLSTHFGALLPKVTEQQKQPIKG